MELMRQDDLREPFTLGGLLPAIPDPDCGDQCTFCGKVPDLQTFCGKCRKVPFCSVECLTKGWSAHEKRCAELSED